jgi:Domain of unknown function (DUF4760)
MSEAWRQNVDRIQKLFPDRASISYKEALKSWNKDAYEAIRFVLNYYEFLAVAVRYGDMDERVLRDCIGTNVVTFCRRAENFIANVRSENTRGQPAPAKARLLCSLRKLNRRWTRQIDRQIRRRTRLANIRKAFGSDP